MIQIRVSLLSIIKFIPFFPCVMKCQNTDIFENNEYFVVFAPSHRGKKRYKKKTNKNLNIIEKGKKKNRLIRLTSLFIDKYKEI